LLVRLKSKDQEAWQRFVHLYDPVVIGWCRRHGLQEADAVDVKQEVFRTVLGAIGGFEKGRNGGSFRGWLRSVTRSRVVDFQRRRARGCDAVGGSDAQERLLEVPEQGEGEGADSEAEEQDDWNSLARRAAEAVLGHCTEPNRKAFLRVVVEGADPAEVARDLGMTANAVYLAKSRILRKIREEYEGLIDV